MNLINGHQPIFNHNQRKGNTSNENISELRIRFGELLYYLIFFIPSFFVLFCLFGSLHKIKCLRYEKLHAEIGLPFSVTKLLSVCTRNEKKIQIADKLFVNFPAIINHIRLQNSHTPSACTFFRFLSLLLCVKQTNKQRIREKLCLCDNN